MQLEVYVKMETPCTSLPLETVKDKSDYINVVEVVMKQEPVKIEEDGLDEVEGNIKQEELDMCDYKSGIKEDGVPIFESNKINETNQYAFASQVKVMSKTPPQTATSLYSENVKKEAEEMDYGELAIKRENIDIYDIKPDVVDIKYIKSEIKQEEDDISEFTVVSNENTELFSSKAISMSEPHDPTIKKGAADIDNITIKQEELDVPDYVSIIKQEHDLVVECNEASTQQYATARQQNDVIMHKCDVCHYQTKRKGHLKEHQKTHLSLDEVELYKCETCGYQTKHKKNVIAHQKRHENRDATVGRYRCEGCDFRTFRLSHLKSHLGTHKKSDTVTMHKCDVCDYQTKHRGVFNRHGLTHLRFDKDDHYVCESCSFRTKHKRSLNRHQMRHLSVDEVNHYLCARCDFQTINVSYFKKHLEIHKKSDEHT